MTNPDTQPIRNSSSLQWSVFAVGSFWRGEALFGRIPGVYHTTVGLASSEHLHSVEAVEVWFHPKRISYHALLRWFWDSIHPQHRPEQRRYQSAIFVVDDDQQKAAQRSITEMEFNYKTDLLHLVQPLQSFEPAGIDQQKYYLQHNPMALALAQKHFSRLELLLHSTTAVRLNSLLGGAASWDELEEQWNTIADLPQEPDSVRSLLVELADKMPKK